MRKLSELYQEVYRESERFGFDLGICNDIWDCGLTKSESKRLEKHFHYGDHRMPINKRIKTDYWFDSGKKRKSYLKYLIKLCKSQNI